MGLWDILVPAEPGVLHNTIANPSFEYDSGVVSKIFGKSYTSSRQLGYWNAIGESSIAASTDWASQGNTSLKISKGVSSGAGVEYYPRSNTFVAPTLTVTSTSSGGTIPNATVVTFAVMGLTDVGLSLASSITDTQMQSILSSSIPLQNLLYPSIDSRRGHSTLWYAQTTTSANNSKVNIAILDNSTSKSNYPRGWAIWYSTNATLSGGVATSGTFMLAGVVPNETSYMNGTISVSKKSFIVNGIDTTFTNYDATNLTTLYTTTGALIGTINIRYSNTLVHLNSNSAVSGENIEFRTTTNVSLLNIVSGNIPTLQSTDKISVSPTSYNTINRTGGSFTGSDIGKHIYIKSNNHQFLFVGTIQTVVGATTVLLINEAQFSPVQQPFYISSEVNPQSFPENNQGSIRMFTVTGGVFSPPEINLDCTAPFWGITNSAFGGFTHKHHLYLDWYLSADNSINPNATYTNTGADWSVYLVNNESGGTGTETLLGKLDATGTPFAAKRMGLRTKFLINRPSGDTKDMRLRIKYTGASTSDAVLYIDGVQFVDVGMIWRAYDWYGSNIGAYSNPPQFEDWDWDDVEFSYVDGDTPGAIWSDTMPTQSGTYTSSFPYFTNSGVWMRDQYEYETPSATTSAGGYSGPRFRLNYQWKNSASPVYGISVPGLSQSSMQTQTFTTGFWAPLSTDNINVIVEPSISGVGMPEVATTAIEYGIVDGGYVQRQVARMRNLQFTITISAKSWTGLHANRRSLINLLKFDQLSQQGERKIRYRGADVPLVTSVTYQSGLEYSGTQGTSFTEALALRFLATDPYFYTENSISTNVSPGYENKSNFSHVMYKLGRNSSWLPLSHRYYSYDTASNAMISGSSYFYDSNYNYSAPYGIGWLQSPSGNVTALVVSGGFSFPVNKLAIFYVSGYDGGLTDSTNTISSSLGSNGITTSTANKLWSTTNANEITDDDIGKFVFSGTGLFVGQIASVSTSTSGEFAQNALQTLSNNDWYLVTVSSTIFQSLPNNVYLYNLLSVDSSADAILTLQESANSVVVYGDVSSIVDMGANQPYSNYTGNDVENKGYIYSEKTNPSPVYKNRIFRIFMNDNGKISTEAVDDVFSISTTEQSNNAVIYESSFYTLSKSQRLNQLAKSFNNYFVGTTEGFSSFNVVNYDNTLPYAIDRSTSAFASDGVVTSVIGIDPLGNPISVGVRQALKNSSGQSITTYNASCVVRGAGTLWSGEMVGRKLFTRNGLYIGTIIYVESNTLLYLAEPASVKLTSDQFEISVDLDSITFDKKSINSNIYVAPNDSVVEISSNTFKTAVFGYFNSPNVFDNVSIIAGSRSIGSMASFYTRFVQKGEFIPTITFSTSTTEASIDVLAATKLVLNDISVGTYIIDNGTVDTANTNRIIGCVAEIVSDQKIKFRNIPAYAGTNIPFAFRSTKQLVDVSGYKSLVGNIKTIFSPYIAESEFSPTESYSNAFVPNFIVPSLNASNGSEKVYKTPYLFEDSAAAELTGYVQLADEATSTVARRGIFETYGRDPFSLVTATYRTNGMGIIVSGYNTPLLVQRTAALRTTVNSVNFNFTANTFIATDQGRSVYDNTKRFLGVIKTLDPSGGSGTFVEDCPITIPNPGISPFVTDYWWPFQFKLFEKTQDNFYSARNLVEGKTFTVPLGQGIVTTAAGTINPGHTTAITLNTASTAMTDDTKVMCLYAYVSGMWRFNGVISSATSTSVTCNTTAYGAAGTLVAMNQYTPIAIAPALIIMSGSAGIYTEGQDLHGIYTPGGYSGINYLGTIQKVLRKTDSIAILAVMPYTYSQKSVPDFNKWSMANVNSIVWIGAKSYKGYNRESNFFANSLNQIGQTNNGNASVTFLSTPFESNPKSSNVISPGVLPGVISSVITGTSPQRTTIKGFNTAFSPSGTNNPVAASKIIYTYSGSLIGTISSISDSTTIVLSANALLARTGAYYRIGEVSGTLPEGGVVSVIQSDGNPTAKIGLNTFSANNAAAVSVSAPSGNTITVPAIVTDRWIGRAMYASTASISAVVPSDATFVGVIASISTTTITFETTPRVITSAGSYFIKVSAFPTQWTFAPGDIIRTIVDDSTSTSIPGTILGQIYSIDVVDNTLSLTKNATSIITDKPITVQRGKGIGRGSGYITSINPTLATGLITVSRGSLTTVTCNTSVFVGGDVGKSIYVYRSTSTPVYSFVGVISAIGGGGTSATISANSAIGSFTSLSYSFNNDATIIGADTFFSTLPFRPLIGSVIDIYADVSSSDSYSNSSLGSYNGFVLLGQISTLNSNDSIVVRNARYKLVSDVSLAWYYVIRNVSNTSSSGSVYPSDILTQKDFYTNTYNDYLIGSMAGLGTISGVSTGNTINYINASASNFCIMNGVNQIAGSSVAPTQFTYQVAPGDYIILYNSSTNNVVTNTSNMYRVVEVLSDYSMIVANISGSSGGATSGSYKFVIFKSTDEMLAFDRGVTAYTNNDWQDLGYTDKPVETLASTSNGDVYAGGSFTQWAKQSATVLPSTLPGDTSQVKRIAKIVTGLNGYNYITDAYGVPIAGNSYTNNGFADGKVQVITEASEINPLNGYMGGYDSVMVGGTFTITTDNTPVESGLVYLPSSSIANSMRQITTGDLSVVSDNNVNFSGVFGIATTNRLRSYNDYVSTNVLDGINGMNVAILLDDSATIAHTTKYFPVRIRGNASCYPVVTISYFTTSNVALNVSKSLYSLEQTETGAKIYFINNQLRIYNGEIVTIDFRIGKRTVNSNLRGNLSSSLNPNSNFVDFVLLGANNSAGLSTQSYDDYRVNVVGVHADYGITVTVSYVPRFWSFDANNLFFGSPKAGL